MLGYYNYTVILTYLGLVTGFIGITRAADRDLKGALFCLMFAGLCDMFDGRIASTMDRSRSEKLFGIQIDSLSDLICFGALPAMIVYTCCGGGKFREIVPALYLLCALIRLAWFNVDEARRQERETGCRDTFFGLPVTSSALLLPCVIGICSRQHWAVNIAGPAALILMGAAFLIPFRMKKPALPGKLGMLLCGSVGMLLLVTSGGEI